MDFSNHPLNKQSTVDNRHSKQLLKSTVDYHTERLRTKLGDPELGKGMVAMALARLGEAEIESISDYALRKGSHPGKVFVKTCSNAIREKS